MVSLDANRQSDNSLKKCPWCVAALWLHSQVTDRRKLARVGTVVETWAKLPNDLKTVIEDTAHRSVVDWAWVN